MAKFFISSQLSENIAETPEGFLLCLNVPITRTGELLYGEGETPLETNDDGEILISRRKEDIHDVNCIASFEGKSITINHPEKFVDPHNHKDLEKGHMFNVRPNPENIEVDGKEEDSLLADLLIKDFMAIQLVKNGLREVSLGYDAEYEQEGKGKGRQTNIRGNHIALVDAGRAGEKFAVQDHQGKGKVMSKIAELLKKLHATADAEMSEKDDKAKDEEKKEESKDEEAMSMDALVTKMTDAFKGAMDDFIAKNKKDDKSSDADKDDEKKDESKDEDGGVESRLKNIEAALAKLLESKAQDDDEEVEDDESESEDDDMGGAYDEEASSFTGDTAARAEILAPGIKASKNIKTDAVKAFYKTAEGKQVIDLLTKGKPTFDSKSVDGLFVSASEVVKLQRGTGLEKTKDAKKFADQVRDQVNSTEVTAEKMNEINAKKYNLN